MAKVKQIIKTICIYFWEMFKDALPSIFMYGCAGGLLIVLTLKDKKTDWDQTKLIWSIVCGVAALAYTALLMWGCGGQHYEMLVSGNIKRTTAETYGTAYKISSHKEVKEYREWKGFAIGGFMAILPIVAAIIFGANQEALDNATLKGGFLSIVMVIFFFVSGWTILPFFYMNQSGIAISYYWSGLLGLLPIIVSGVFYIIGAYARRNKTVRQQVLADKVAAEKATKEKKINYGALPGTKPKKRK